MCFKMVWDTLNMSFKSLASKMKYVRKRLIIHSFESTVEPRFNNPEGTGKFVL